MIWPIYAFVGLPLCFGLWSVLVDRHRVTTLPLLNDEAFASLCPLGLTPHDWVAARRDLGRFLRLPPERLAPEMALQALGEHFHFFGLPRLYADYDDLEEAFSKVEGDGLRAARTLGDVMTMMVSQSIRYG